MRKRFYLYIVLLSFITNLLYYLCFILLKTDNSLSEFFKGIVINFPTSLYYLVPSVIPSLYFILIGIIIYKQKNIYFNLFLSFTLVILDIFFIKFLYGDINIDMMLLFIRIMFGIFYIITCILYSQKR